MTGLGALLWHLVALLRPEGRGAGWPGPEPGDNPGGERVGDPFPRAAALRRAGQAPPGAVGCPAARVAPVARRAPVGSCAASPIGLDPL